MAGESARAVAQTRRDKADRLNRVADAYDRGADGEVATAHALAALPVSGWFVLHDVRWPGKRFANIDHVVIGPGGVFVIDSKAWSGAVGVRDGVLRQNGCQRDSAVAGATDAAMAVAEQVSGVDPRAVQPVLCFVGDHHDRGRAGDVLLCTPSTLVSASDDSAGDSGRTDRAANAVGPPGSAEGGDCRGGASQAPFFHQSDASIEVSASTRPVGLEAAGVPGHGRLLARRSARAPATRLAPSPPRGTTPRNVRHPGGQHTPATVAGDRGPCRHRPQRQALAVPRHGPSTLRRARPDQERRPAALGVTTGHDVPGDRCRRDPAQE